RRKTHDLRARPRNGVVRCAGHPRRRPERWEDQLSFLVHRPRGREQRAVPHAPGGGRGEERGGVMIVTKKQLPRRTLLRAMGTAVALPVLDAMVPAFTAQAKTAAAPVPRLGFVYTPNGYMRQFWVPKAAGRDWEVTRSLQSIAPYRDKVTLVSGLAQR